MRKQATHCHICTYKTSNQDIWHYSVEVYNEKGNNLWFHKASLGGWSLLMESLGHVVDAHVRPFLNDPEFLELDTMMRHFRQSQYEGHYIDIQVLEYTSGMTSVSTRHALAGNALSVAATIEVPSDSEEVTEAGDVDLLSIIPF